MHTRKTLPHQDQDPKLADEEKARGSLHPRIRCSMHCTVLKPKRYCRQWRRMESDRGTIPVSHATSSSSRDIIPGTRKRACCSTHRPYAVLEARNVFVKLSDTLSPSIVQSQVSLCIASPTNSANKSPAAPQNLVNTTGAASASRCQPSTTFARAS